MGGGEEDVLQRLSEQNVTKLLDVLKQDMPASTVVYQWLVTQLEWSSHLPQLTVHVLCPRGEWQQGTVVAFADGLALENKKYGVVYARPHHDADLAAALTSTREVPWHDMFHFGGVLERHVAMVRNGATAAGVSLPADQLPLFYLLFCPANLAMKKDKISEPEDGIRVCRLEPRHLEEIWQLRSIFPDFYKPVIRACLEYNFGAGVFKTMPDGSEKLISMTIQSEYGGLGMGQTHPDYLNQGYSNRAAQVVVRTLSEQGVDLHTWTAIDNHIVIKFLESRGAKVVDKAKRLIISPNCGPLMGQL